MHRSYATRVITACLGLLPAMLGLGFEGRITSTKGQLPANLAIQVYKDNQVVDTLHPAADGSFRGRELPAGNYEIRLIDTRGDTIGKQYVTLGAHTGWIDLRVPVAEHIRPPSGTVSVRELATRIPRQAKKEIERSERAYRRGRLQESIAHLESALEACPHCMQVHNNLGARYMRAGDTGAAVESFRRAAALDPDNAAVHSNLAIALVTLREFDAAEAPARRALSLDHGSISARYALGLIALSRRDCTPAALNHLRAAAELHARARLSTAFALLCRGDREAAARELSIYLEDPNAGQRDQVERWRTQILSGHE